MKAFIAVLAMVAVAVVLTLGGGYAVAQDKAKAVSPECEKSFMSADNGNKGFLTMSDFEAMHHDPGKHKGYPVGTTMDKTHFEKLDKDKNGKVTIEEYCGK